MISANLIIDSYYEGGSKGNAGDDPISKLLPCGNQGGFRTRRNKKGKHAFAILYSSLDEPDWSDTLDEETGIFVYFGDNRTPGHALHDTPRKGNELLRDCYNKLACQPPNRLGIPPFFIFTNGVKGRDVVFRGLAAPGSNLLNANEELVAIWKNKSGERFQNYRAVFTILDVPEVSRDWIQDLLEGNILTNNTPNPWKKWVIDGIYSPLQAPSTLSFRTKEQQTPDTINKKEMIEVIYKYFKKRPTDFEYCAAEIAKMMDPNILSIEVTRHSRDGGRDGLGKYRIGTSGDNIKVDFSLEAKCYKSGQGVGTKEVSRLISRFRNRQFGILITTSHLDPQAYNEIRQDGHPIIIVSGVNIVNILLQAGIGSAEEVNQWLKSKF